MATNTTNLSLIKPDLTDKIRIAQINQNMDIIDEKLGPVGSTSLQSQVTPLTTKTANYDKLIENGTDLNSLLTTGVYKSPATAAGVHTLLNCPIETPFVMVVRGEGEIDGCVQLLCGGVSIYTRRGTGSGFPAEWTVPTGGATPSGEYTIDDLYDAIDELLANAKDEIVAELVDDTAGEGDTGKVWSADKLATTFDEKANIDGYYDDLTAGNAEQLISAVNVKDTAPYTFRTAGGSADIGDREVDKLIGGTIVWNQLVSGNFNGASSKRVPISSTYTSMSYADNILTLTKLGSSSVCGFYDKNNKPIRNHKYLMACDINPSENTSIRFLATQAAGGSATSADGSLTKGFNANEWGKIEKIISVGDTTAVGFLVYVDIDNAMSVNSTVKCKNYCVFDITQMFGVTIADYIYSLEQATAGAGVAWFKRYFPKDYYARNEGELMSVNVASHNMVGFNQWDEEWTKGYYNLETGRLVVQSESSTTLASVNKIKVLPNTNYSVTTPTVSSVVFEYDSNGTYIKRTTGIKGVFTTQLKTYEIAFHIPNYGSGAYNNDVCINLSLDGERDGEYEAYTKHSYSIGNVELHGIPQLDANNSLYYDGDEYANDGTVTRKYGIVDLGALTYAMPSDSSDLRFYTTGISNSIRKKGGLLNLICANFIACNSLTAMRNQTDGMWVSDSGNISFNIGNYSSAADFKTAMSGVYLVYELETPIIETADTYSNPQIVNDFGTEEYVDRGVATSARDVSIPVGHETYYQANLRAKLEMAPNSPSDGDGDYIVRQTSGTNEYIKLENAEAIAALDAKKADIDGYYEQMTVGNAEQLVSTVGITDKVSYNFRTSGGSADIGDRMVDKLIGGTIVWNQLVPESKKSGITTPPGTQTYSGWSTSYLPEADHAYVIRAKIIYNGNKVPLRAYATLGVPAVYAGPVVDIETAGTIDVWLSGSTTTIPTNPIVVGVSTLNQTILSSDDTWSIDNVSIFDITKMFGVDIGNYFLSLTHPNRKKWFNNLFPKPYYEYNAGELMSVKALSHDTVGFNLWDEEWEVGGIDGTTGENITGNDRFRSKNYIKVIPGANYYFAYKGSLTTPSFYVCQYDANKNFIRRNQIIRNTVSAISENCHYIRFFLYDGGSEYKNDICINLSWDGERNGEYEPFVKRSYPLGNVELRGIPMLDANNSLYYDGDEYTDDGKVIRKYGIVDLSTLTWTTRSTGDSNKGYSADLPTGMGYAPIYSGILSNMRATEYEIKGVASGALIQQNGADYYDIGIYTLRQGGGSTRAIYVITDKNSTPSGMLLWKLSTPTTETADPFQNPQIVDDFGTEEYVDRGVATSARDVSIPVGHETVYQPNLRAKLEMVPDSPAGDGDYIVRQSNGENTYVPLVIPAELPTAPTTDGTYILKVTVSSGTPTLTWVAQ